MPLIITALLFLVVGLIIGIIIGRLLAGGAVAQQLQDAHRTIERTQAELTYKQQKLEEQKTDIERIGEKFATQFKILAGNIVEEKTKIFTEQQQHNLKTILDPLKENIQTFKKEFEDKFLVESKDRSSLSEQIKQMLQLNQSLADQANNLTNALRGNVKQQGNWGEMILESILEYAGLKRDIHYTVQARSQNTEGQIIQPDVIVRYPDERAIVIDAKVSLVHYEAYCATTDTLERNQHLAQMVRSLKNHIDGLSGKLYHDVIHAFDMVIMFVPIEAAYITAMQADTDLWRYAYNKRVLLISPTNLIAAMKIVSDMWQRDNINKEAHNIAERAGRLYDKLVLFVENFQKVGNQMDKARETWDDAYKQLTRGKGNLISQAEQMKEYKIKTGKSLPAQLIAEAQLEDGMQGEEDV